MKKFLLLLATALMISAVACEKKPEEKPKDDPTDKPDDKPVEEEKSKACKILAFSVANGRVEIEGAIFDEENYVELTYEPEQAFAISNATASFEISPKATISPDPSTITDWTKEVKLTVTAEDGTTQKEYSIQPAPRRYVVSIAKSAEKSTADMGAASIASFGGNNHAFCDVDKFADAAGNVFDLSLAKVGTLNMEGITGTIATMANDDYGVLIAAVSYDEAGAPAFGPAASVSTKFFAWPDGYDKAPVEIYSNDGNVAQYLNVTGDFRGDMYAFAYPDGRQGQHHIWTFHNGQKPDGSKWRWFDTGMLDNRWNDGGSAGDTSDEYFYAAGLNNTLSSGQNVSAVEITAGADGKPSGGIYAFASASPEWDGTPDNSSKAWWRAAGSLVYAREGVDGENVAMPGDIKDLVATFDKHGGKLQYGNTDFCAAIKAFNYAGTHFAAIAHVGVQQAYMTVQNIDYYLKGEGSQYLLKTSFAFAGEAAHVNDKPSVAYVLNSATGEGHIVASYIGGMSDAAGPFGYVVYKLTREAL